MRPATLRATTIVAVFGGAVALISTVVFPDWTVWLLGIGALLELVGFGAYVVYAMNVLASLLPDETVDTTHRPF